MNIRLDDLQTNGYFIYQDSDAFCFGIDAVLLSSYAAKDVRKKDRAADLCSGNGIIPILLSAKNPPSEITAVEIDPDMCALFEKSVEYNGIKNITILNEDLRSLDKSLYNSFDLVTVNPPYYRTDSGEKSENSKLGRARHEVDCTFEDVARISSKLLKSRGRLFLVHRTARLEEIISTLAGHSFSVKEIRFIYPRKGRNSNLFLMKAVKNGGKETKVHEPLYVYDEDGGYTGEVLEMYNE